MCSICGKDIDEPIELGPILEKKDLKVHYFCLLLSTHLLQRGQDTGGILGFLVRDIRLEAENAKRRVCVYCKENGASVKCKECPVYFHVFCGVTNKCLFQFVDRFHSFCRLHQIIKNAVTHDNDAGCHICMEALGQYHPVTSIAAGCCSNGFAHKKCLQKYALCAGYYFKCVWCRSPSFRDEARVKGIFIPDRDAQWEREEKSFYGNFYKKYSVCDAQICRCPKGRGYVQKRSIGSKWSLYICCTCAATGIHLGCSNGNISDEYMCDSCKVVFNATIQASSPAPNFLKIDDKYDLTMYMTKTQIQFQTQTYPHSDVLCEEESHETSEKRDDDVTESLAQREEIPVNCENERERMEVFYRYDKKTQLMTSVLGIPKGSTKEDGLEFEKEIRHTFKPRKDREFYAFMNELFTDCFERYKRSRDCGEIADNTIPKNINSNIRKMLPPRNPMRRSKRGGRPQF